jgi:TRAP-type transport system small permease protein
MKRLLSNLARGNEKVSQLFGFIASYMILVLIAFLAINVIMRYFVHRPFAFTEEITGYLLTFIVFIGLAYTMRVGAHVITNILISHLSDRAYEQLVIIRNFIGVIFAIFLTVSAWTLMIKNYIRRTIDFGSLETPVWIPNVIFVVGATLFLFEMIVMFVKSVKRGK